MSLWLVAELSGLYYNNSVTGGRASRGEYLEYMLPQFGHHAMRVQFWFDMMQQYAEEDAAAAVSYHAWYYSSRWLARTNSNHDLPLNVGPKSPQR